MNNITLYQTIYTDCRHNKSVWFTMKNSENEHEPNECSVFGCIYRIISVSPWAQSKQDSVFEAETRTHHT